MRKFTIPSTPPAVNKTIRFLSDAVADVGKEIQGKDCTFSAFVITAVRAALDDLKDCSVICKTKHPGGRRTIVINRF